MPLRLLVRLVLFLTALCMPCHAWAQTDESNDEIQELKQQGNEAMVSGRPEDALIAYERAYAIEPRPELLYNRGRALQALARYPEALEVLVQFKKKAPEELRNRVHGLDDLIDEVRSRIHTIKLSVNVTEAEVELRGQDLPAALQGPVQVNAGPGKLRITAKGYAPYERSLPLEGGKTSTIRVKLIRLDVSGVLRINSPRVGALVTIDDKRQGTVPVEVRLPEGSHQVLVEKDGYKPAETSVMVSPGERREVEIDLAKRKKVTQRWWFWTALGVGVAGGVTAAIVATSEREPDKGSIPPGQVSF